MKGFIRKDLSFSLCGLKCALCPMNLKGHCPGCGGGEGNQACKLARCSLEKGGPAYCSLCGDFPCAQYEGITARDSFITHRHQLLDLARAEEMGAAAFGEELAQRKALLLRMLPILDDGRSQTLCLLACNLLPLNSLQALMVQLETARAAPGFDPRAARNLVRETGNQLGIPLALRRG